MRVETFVRGPLQNNVYLLCDELSNEAAIIDPGIGSDDLLKTIEEQQLRLRYVLVTHAHFDHIDNVALFREQTGANVVSHRADAAVLEELAGVSSDVLLDGGEELALGNLTPPDIPHAGTLPRRRLLFGGKTTCLQAIRSLPDPSVGATSRTAMARCCSEPLPRRSCRCPTRPTYCPATVRQLRWERSAPTPFLAGVGGVGAL